MNSIGQNHRPVNLRQIGQGSTWQRIKAFWAVLGSRDTFSLDPEILQGDRRWWYVYESTTGRLTYLESERDIDMWLDETYRNQ